MDSGSFRSKEAAAVLLSCHVIMYVAILFLLTFTNIIFDLGINVSFCILHSRKIKIVCVN